MEAVDSIYGFRLVPDFNICYIPMEGVRDVKLMDGTILTVPMHMYHHLTIELMQRSDHKTIIHPRRKKFKFTMMDVEKVPTRIRMLLLENSPQETELIENELFKKVKKLMSQPVRNRTTVGFFYRNVAYKINLYYWNKNKTFMRHDGEKWNIYNSDVLNPVLYDIMTILVKKEKLIQYVSNYIFNLLKTKVNHKI